MKVDPDGAPEVGERGMYRLRVIDFDWAGKHGEVCYPPCRNDGESWPAPRGALIEPRHDAGTVDTWWKNYNCLSSHCTCCFRPRGLTLFVSLSTTNLTVCLLFCRNACAECCKYEYTFNHVGS